MHHYIFERKVLAIPGAVAADSHNALDAIGQRAIEELHLVARPLGNRRFEGTEVVAQEWYQPVAIETTPLVRPETSTPSTATPGRMRPEYWSS